MIEITVNGKSVTIPSAVTVTELLEHLGYNQGFVAVALNHAHVRRGDFTTTIVDRHTDVEVLAPMAGG